MTKKLAKDVLVGEFLQFRGDWNKVLGVVPNTETGGLYIALSSNMILRCTSSDRWTVVKATNDPVEESFMVRTEPESVDAWLAVVGEGWERDNPAERLKYYAKDVREVPSYLAGIELAESLKIGDRVRITEGWSGSLATVMSEPSYYQGDWRLLIFPDGWECTLQMDLPVIERA